VTTLGAIWSEAQTRLGGVGDGQALSVLDEALIHFGVASAVTSLDRDAIKRSLALAIGAGATRTQLLEVTSLVSGLGVHSLMVAAKPIVDATDDGSPTDATLSAAQQELWDRYVGQDPYWTAFDAELPGFLDSMLRLSEAQFAAFFSYCAVPWQTRSVRGRLKELIAMASDATPTHRFMPGFRLHLANAIKLGAGRQEIEAALKIAASAPPHEGA
jgi:alkylhydroperoxidase/carboxymuconolactone decarboxylase family protein YurZ